MAKETLPREFREENGEPESPYKYLRPDGKLSWLQKRREKMVAEIDRNRRGEFKVPTWVLAVLLLAVILGWAALVIFG